MYKKIIIFCILVGFSWLSIWYLLNTEEKTITNNNTNDTLYQTERQDDVVLVNDFIEPEKVVSKIDTTQSEEITIEYSEVTFEEILYPEEYDFKSVDAGEVYEKAGTKIKADFSYMIDKKIGDEVTVHFLNESLSGTIVDRENTYFTKTSSRSSLWIDLNNSKFKSRNIPENIRITISEENNFVYRAYGTYNTFHSDGMFILKNGIGYFTTKEDYGKIAKDVIKFD